MKHIIKDYSITGIYTIDVDRVVKKWNHLWIISQWHDKFTLVKHARKDSPITVLKVQISAAQAKELADRLELWRHPSTLFKNGATWK